MEGIQLLKPSNGKANPKIKQEDAVQSSSQSPLVKEDASFADLGLAPWLLKICKQMKFLKPTPVQQNCIPAVLAGKSVLGQAETGSGKTGAFALPILHKLSEDPFSIYAVVLTPTRELAVQIAEQMRVFGAPMKLRLSLVIGGRDMIQQALQLDQHPHVIIATPGRLADHLSSTDTLKLNRIKYIVYDEADRLLDGGFDKEIRTIAKALSPQHQTLLFSATVPNTLIPHLHSLTNSKANVSDYFTFFATKKPTTVENLVQEYIFMPRRVKLTYLVYLMTQNIANSIIIFTDRCKSAELIRVMFKELGIDAVSLHSQLSQEARLRALDSFRSKIVNVLIATDVASRGLDIPQVDLVVSFDLPDEPETYVHRVGRTARAGRSGRAITLMTQFDIEKLHKIEELIGLKLSEFPTKEEEVLKHLNETGVAERIANQYLIDTEFGVRAHINKMKRRQRDQLMAQEGGEEAVKREKKKKVKPVEKKQLLEKTNSSHPHKKKK